MYEGRADAWSRLGCEAIILILPGQVIEDLHPHRLQVTDSQVVCVIILK